MLATTAIETAFVRYRGDVYKFLLRRTGNHADAEELTQEVFTAAAVTLSHADAPDSMRGWLYTVAERRLIDELRRRRRAAEAVGALSRECENRDGDPHEALEAALLRLPRAQRRLVFMRVVEGWAYSEIAGELGCNEAACKMRLSRALRRLRDDLRAES